MDAEIIDFNQQDPAIEAKVEALLSQMTLEEKVGQLVLDSPYAALDPKEIARQRKLAKQKGIPFLPLPVLAPEAEELIRKGKISSIISDVPGFINRIQRIAVEESRLGIPILVGADIIHGYRTTFPIPLGESCTWNPDLLERASRAAAVEAAVAGIHMIYAPMVDIARDPRWGRIAEGGGEDPFLGRALSRARVRGFQWAGLPGGRRITACPKHYAAYGAAEGGRDYNTVDVSERTLRDLYLPPFKAGFDQGAGSTMSSFNEISGIPATCSHFLLRTVLRDEWGWHGVVVSDYNAIAELINHGVAADLREAARLAILAGVDIDMASKAYLLHLQSLVEDGSVPVEVLDGSVRRVLRLKYQLGLFDNPYVDESLYGQFVLADEHRRVALEVARQSMVLLKNEKNILPLNPGTQKIALIGPLADNRVDILGTWAAAGQPDDAISVLDAFRSVIPEDRLAYVEGCPVSGEGELATQAVTAAVRAADVVILVVGESRELSGEAHSRVHLGLPGRQQELADLACGLGKPVVTVIMSGRPLVIPRLAGQSNALLAAWHAGICAGQAVADILFGKVNPSGRLTAAWPRHEGQIPVYYGQKATGRPAESAGTTQFFEPFRSTYMDEPNSPLFSFGMGMSYTKFQYSQLTVETPSVNAGETLKASVVVRNTGRRAGAEVVQLYIRDLVGSVTRPVKELKGFQRVELKAGEQQRVSFDVPAHELGFHDLTMRYVVEAGRFKLWIGPDSTTGLEGEFEVY